MQAKNSKWKLWWQKLKNVYRFQVVEEKTYDVKFVLELNRLNVITIAGILTGLLTLINFLFIAYTPLKQYIPGYGTTDSRKDIINLKLKTEELEEKISANDKYNKNLKDILSDKIKVGKLEDHIVAVEVDSNVLAHIAPNEHKLIKEIEQGLRNSVLYDNLKYKKQNDVLKTLRTLAPVSSTPIQQFKNSKTAYKTIYPAQENAIVSATIDGYILAIEEQADKNYTIIIQHQNEMISKYRNIQQISRKITNFVSAGDEIGKTNGNTNTEYELWYKGMPINVEKYYK